MGKDYVEGLVESVSGNAIQLRTRTGAATVDFTPSTRIADVTPAQLTDVTPGSCVNVRATPQSAPTGAAIAAQSVTITPAIDGKCPPSLGFYGTVASVSGNTIAVNNTAVGGQTTPTNVTVTNTTSYSKQTATNAQAIAHGKCMGLREQTATAYCKRRSSVSKRAHQWAARTTIFTSPTSPSTSRGL